MMGSSRLKQRNRSPSPCSSSVRHSNSPGHRRRHRAYTRREPRRICTPKNVYIVIVVVLVIFVLNRTGILITVLQIPSATLFPSRKFHCALKNTVSSRIVSYRIVV